MEDRTIIISSRELSDHTVLSRKRHELAFKRDFLVKAGAKPGDLHLKAIEDELFAVEEKLRPIADKLSLADMITVVPNRKEISEFTGRINRFSRGELDSAIRNKNGEPYDLMKKRALLVKGNFDRREDIARLSILLNSAPRQEGEAIQRLIEEGSGEDVDVSFFPKQSQQELLNLASRIGRQCCVVAGTLSLDKKKVDRADLRPDDEVRRTAAGRQVWVSAASVPEFESNEKSLSEILAKIQAKTAEKQARALDEKELSELDRMQRDYIAAKDKRARLCRGLELTETAKVCKKAQQALMKLPDEEKALF